MVCALRSICCNVVRAALASTTLVIAVFAAGDAAEPVVTEAMNTGETLREK